MLPNLLLIVIDMLAMAFNEADYMLDSIQAISLAALGTTATHTTWLMKKGTTGRQIRLPVGKYILEVCTAVEKSTQNPQASAHQLSVGGRMCGYGTMDMMAERAR